MYVHVLEVMAVILVIVSVIQVFRCYRAFNKTSQTPNIASSGTSSSIKEIARSYQGAGQILHDYIGEFFVENASSLNQLQNRSSLESSVVGSSSKLKAAIVNDNDVKIQIEKPAAAHSNILNFDERPETATDKKLMDDEEDSVITVMDAPDITSGICDGNVMSDKVVHAMLDEAKLVCAS